MSLTIKNNGINPTGVLSTDIKDGKIYTHYHDHNIIMNLEKSNRFSKNYSKNC